MNLLAADTQYRRRRFRQLVVNLLFTTVKFSKREWRNYLVLQARRRRKTVKIQPQFDADRGLTMQRFPMTCRLRETTRSFNRNRGGILLPLSMYCLPALAVFPPRLGRQLRTTPHPQPVLLPYPAYAATYHPTASVLRLDQRHVQKVLNYVEVAPDLAV